MQPTTDRITQISQLSLEQFTQQQLDNDFQDVPLRTKMMITGGLDPLSETLSSWLTHYKQEALKP